MLEGGATPHLRIRRGAKVRQRLHCLGPNTSLGRGASTEESYRTYLAEITGKWEMNAESNLDVVFLEVVSQDPFGVDLFAMPLTSRRIRQGRDAVHQNLSKTNIT